MTIQTQIEEKLADNLAVKYLDVVNESGNHNVPEGSESHFKVVVVADDFDGQRLIQRHRRINEILKPELATAVHALTMHTYTESEWIEKHGEVPQSPPCHGGSGEETG